MENKPNPVSIVAQCVAAAAVFLLFASYVAVRTQVGGNMPISSIALVGVIGIGLMYWMQMRRVELGFRKVIVPKGQHPWDHAFDWLKKRS